nr:MAG: Asp-tRNA(Asn)/Glu-tRNA(Gln) amidotransferase GatCAB subunit C [Pseudomonadota bacterium]
MSEMELAREDVERAARLAAIALDEEEVERFRRDLSSMVTYFDRLLSLDLDDVPPMAHASAGIAPTRSDEVQPGLPVEKAVANAPQSDGPFFVVPRIIE